MTGVQTCALPICFPVTIPKHSQLGLNRAGVESKFYSEGALGELNLTLKTVLDILKGISSVRGR